MLSRAVIRSFSSKKGQSLSINHTQMLCNKSSIAEQMCNKYIKCKDIPEPPESELDTCAVNPAWSQPRIIIIGAGIAGLSVAQHLLQCGIQNFLILEATNRPGGRIHSRWMGDCMTELGSMWIEGASVANSVFLLATQEGLLTPPLQRRKRVENTSFFSAKGKTIDPPAAEAALGTFEEILLHKIFKPKLLKGSTSLGDFIQGQLSKELHSIPTPMKNDVSRVIGCLYNELQSEIGTDPCYVHPYALSEREYLPGGRISIPLGFGSVLAPLLRALLPCNIMYCKPVHYVLWDTASKTRATVVCSDKEEFPADYVVVTVPLGVLKANIDIMFNPPLPDDKITAIEKLGFGNIERVFIQYKQPFWVGNSGIGLGWTLREIKTQSEDWRHGIGALSVVPGSAYILQGTLGGAAAIAISDIPENRLIPEAGDLLRRFSGDSTLPNPINVQRSNWTFDQFFNGACTYLGLDSELSHLKRMAEPIPNPKEVTESTDPPILLFAGEATSLFNYSTVHGARESGIREARRIIELTNIYHGPPVCNSADKSTEARK